MADYLRTLEPEYIDSRPHFVQVTLYASFQLCQRTLEHVTLLYHISKWARGEKISSSSPHETNLFTTRSDKLQVTCNFG